MNINQMNTASLKNRPPETVQAKKPPAEAAPAEKLASSAAVYVAGLEEDLATCLETVDGQNGTMGEDEISTGEKKEKDEKESLKDASDKLTSEDCMVLAEEGMSLEAYEAGRLDRALERIKTNKTERRENLTERTEKKEEWEKELDKIAVANKISDPLKKKIAQKLLDSDLPLTSANIEQAVSAVLMADAAGSLKDEGIAYLMQNRKPATIENIYHSQYSGVREKAVEDTVWESVKKQVGEIVSKAGLEVNEGTLEDARWMMDHQLPISGESFEKLYDLRSIRDEYTQEDALNKIMKAMCGGTEPKDVNLSSRLEKKAEEAIQGFHDISGEAIDVLVKAGEEITLDNMKEAKTAGTGVILNASEEIAAVTARRQLEEIRLKMTQEAGISLLKKGIRLDTSGLQKIVDGLKELENQYYRDSIKEAGVPATEENISLWKEASQKLQDLKEVPEYIIGITLKRRELETIDSLHTSGTSMKARLDKAGETYETLMTTPRGDLGDSIQKAFRNVDDILQDMGLPVTLDNQRAIRILARNQMDLSQDNIREVRAYDLSLRELLTDLKPAVTLEMIRLGENPLSMTLSELKDEAKAIQEDIGITAEEKYSEFLYKLEKKQGISEEERRSYIGIYRLLNQVEKSDGAAIGTVLKNGQELNLKNLLSAVRSRKNAGMDVSVDDNFGVLEELSFTKERISEQVSAAFSSADRLPHSQPEEMLADRVQESGGTASAPAQSKNRMQEYAEYQVKRILEETSPDRIQEIMGNGLEEFLEKPLDEVKDLMEQATEGAQENKEYFTHVANHIREIAATGERAVEFLEKYGVDTTIRNIDAAQTFFVGNKNLSKEMKEKADKLYTETVNPIADAAGSEDGLKAAYEKAADQLKTLLNQEKTESADSYDSISALQLLSQGIELARKLSQKEHYFIPIVTDGQITNVSLTVLKDAKETGRIQVGVDSDSMGRVEAELKVKRQVINGFILCDSREGLEAMAECREAMAKGFEALGLDCGQITAGLDKKGVENFRNQMAGSSSEEQKTEMEILYQAARVIIDSVRDAAEKQLNI